MNDGETTHKFVAVLNKKIEPGKALNALGHMAAGLGGKVSDETKVEMKFDDYIDKDDGVHPSISDNPFIVLRAKNSNKIRNLRQQLIEKEIPFTDFTDTMTVGTYVEQHERTKNTPEEELEYFGICFFGPKSELDPLTTKFSLWQ